MGTQRDKAGVPAPNPRPDPTRGNSPPAPCPPPASRPRTSRGGGAPGPRLSSQALPPPPPPCPREDQRDLLSEALIHTELRAMLGPPWLLSAPWAVALPTGFLHFVQLRRGRCLIRFGPPWRQVELAPEDLFILTRPVEIVLCDHPATPPTPLADLLKAEHRFEGRLLVHGGGGEQAELLCGGIILHQRPHVPLASFLPACIHLPAAHPLQAAVFQPLLAMARAEVDCRRPGGMNIVDHLIQALFVHAVRSQLRQNDPGGQLDLAALKDPEIGRVLTRVHLVPDESWSVDAMAALAAMSRSAFSARFTRLVGQTPMAYVTDCRMRLAMRCLIHEPTGVKELAGQLGYSTGASFSVAFKRWSGLAPGDFRQQMQLRHALPPAADAAAAP